MTATIGKITFGEMSVGFDAQAAVLTEQLCEALKENKRLREENARLSKLYEEAKQLAKLAIKAGK